MKATTTNQLATEEWDILYIYDSGAKDRWTEGRAGECLEAQKNKKHDRITFNSK